MKILFVTSEYQNPLYSELGTFTTEYVRELRKHCDVKCVYFHLLNTKPPLPDKTIDYVFSPNAVYESFTSEAKLLERSASLRKQIEPILKDFKPDVIHCNNRETYMPFRFEKNVFYSSHLTSSDFISLSSLDEVSFSLVKAEQCAIENSALVASYSEFEAKFIEKYASNLKSSVILPLGFCADKFYHNKNRSDKKLNVCCFDIFGNAQKSLNDFMYAVNLLGPHFKKRNNVEYSVFSSKNINLENINPELDFSLFNKKVFSKSSELFDIFSDADIVVLPCHYKNSALIALMAMASGSLLLTSSGFELDDYAEDGWNCINLPKNPFEIAGILRDSILDFSKLSLLRENAYKTAKELTWERSVKAHMYYYNLIVNNKVSSINNAYSLNERKVISAYKNSYDVEKIFCAEEERIAFSYIFASLSEVEKNKKTLVLTGNFVPEETMFPPNFNFVPALEEGESGVVVRPECLPYNDKSFDSVFIIGAWESVLSPCSALMEAERVSCNKVLVLYKKGRPWEWQTYVMDNKSAWECINKSSWDCSIEDKNEEIFGKLNQSVSYGFVIYTKRPDSKNVLTESIA